MSSIDIDKLSKTFKLDYKIDRNMVFLSNNKRVNSYVFFLSDANVEPLTLVIHEDRTDAVYLKIPASNNFISSLDFSNINKVVYIPEYRCVELISETDSSYMKLKLWWRGQFDLLSYDKKKYSSKIKK